MTKSCLITFYAEHLKTPNTYKSIYRKSQQYYTRTQQVAVVLRPHIG